MAGNNRPETTRGSLKSCLKEARMGLCSQRDPEEVPLSGNNRSEITRGSFKSCLKSQRDPKEVPLSGNNRSEITRGSFKSCLKSQRDPEEVRAKVTRAVNEPASIENMVRPRENIMRRRDSAFVMLSAALLQDEFSEDELDGSFMFSHPTIELMTQSLCGQCPCHYCLPLEGVDLDLNSDDEGNVCPATAPLDVGTPQPPTVAPFTQLVGEMKMKAGPLYDPFGDRFQRSTDGMECVLLEGARAWIGSKTLAVDGCRPLPSAQPCHEVEISSFLIDIEPVSGGSYARFLNSVEAPPEVLMEWCLLPEEDERKTQLPIVRGSGGDWEVKAGLSERWPMFLVSWYGANAYSLWANGQDWQNYREAAGSFLPSEAQWEFAARGDQIRNFPWGDLPATPSLLQVGWSKGNEGFVDLTLEGFRLVDVNVEMGMSKFGLRHMAGNVWQWCRDTFDPAFYSQKEASDADAWNRADGLLKSERGGSWVGPACLARSSYRRGRDPAAQGRCLGFRCIGDAALVSRPGTPTSSTTASSS